MITSWLEEQNYSFVLAIYVLNKWQTAYATYYLNNDDFFSNIEIKLSPRKQKVSL
jgi:hypothetical protein